MHCSEHLLRYDDILSASSASTSFGQKAVELSLSLSLDTIRREEAIAWEALCLLGWMGPGNITKVLLQSLLHVKKMRQKIKEEEESIKQQQQQNEKEEEALKYLHHGAAIIYSKLKSWSGSFGSSIAVLSFLGHLTKFNNNR